METTITKSTAEVYRIRGLKHGCWADITLDYNGSKGRLIISSDYGSWDYYWGACGESFKMFLTSLDIYYVAGKFGEDRFFDLDATIKAWKQDLLSSRKDEYVGSDLARKIYDQIKYIEDGCPSTVREVHSMIYGKCGELLSSYDHIPPIQEVVSPLFRRFWNEAWPVFVNAIKKEFLPIKSA